MNIDLLEKYYLSGEYQKIIEIHTNQDFINIEKNFSDLEESIYISYVSRSFIRLGRLREAENKLSQVNRGYLQGSSQLKDLINETSLINLQITQGKSQESLSRFKNFSDIDHIIKKFSQSEQELTQFWSSYYFYLIGIAFYYELNYKEAEKQFLKSLELNISNEFIKGKSYYYLAFVYLEQNDESNFEEFLAKSTVIFRKLGALEGLGWNLLWQGNRSIQKGDYILAREYLEQSSKIFTNIGGKQELQVIKSLFGLLHFHKGEFDESKKFLNESFDDSFNLGNPMLSSYILLPFTLVNIYLGDREIIERNLKSFETMSKDPRISFHLKLSKALFLKSSKKLIDKAKAEELLLELYKKTKIESSNFFMTGENSTKFFLVINLADIYYMEFLLSNDFAILKEIQDLFEDFNQSTTQIKAQEIIEIALLKSKLLVVEGKITEAISELELAKDLSIKNDYVSLTYQIDQELKKIGDEIDKWGVQSIPVVDRVKAVNMELYIKEALKIAKN